MVDFKIVLCEEPAPIDRLEPCCREKGHEGTHYFWTQVPGGAANFGITVYEDAYEQGGFRGEKPTIKARANLEVAAEFEAEDIFISMLLMDARAEGEGLAEALERATKLLDKDVDG